MDKTEIRYICNDCNNEGLFMPEQSECPFCKSKNLNIKASVYEKIQIRNAMKYKAIDNNLSRKKKVRIEGFAGSEHSKKSKTGFVNKQRFIDRENNRYFEHVEDEEGNLIHHRDEKLTEHTGHGSAKTNKSSQ